MGAMLNIHDVIKVIKIQAKIYLNRVLFQILFMMNNFSCKRGISRYKEYNC